MFFSTSRASLNSRRARRCGHSRSSVDSIYRNDGTEGTLAVDTEVRFRSATDRAAFSNEFTDTIKKLVSKYHNESAPGGRAHRPVVVAHPLPQKTDPRETS